MSMFNRSRDAFAIILIVVLPLNKMSASDSFVKQVDDFVLSVRETDNIAKKKYGEAIVIAKSHSAMTNDIAKMKTILLNPRTTPSQKYQLNREIAKLEPLVNDKITEYNNIKDIMHKLQTDIYKKCDQLLLPIIQKVNPADKEAVLKSTALFDLFVFSDFVELPDLSKISFHENLTWIEVAKLIGKRGIDSIDIIKTVMKSSNISAKYAAAIASGMIGNELDTKDKTVYSEIFSMNVNVLKRKLPKPEIETRRKLLESAMNSLRPIK
jgi:hypothetical protein